MVRSSPFIATLARLACSRGSRCASEEGARDGQGQYEIAPRARGSELRGWEASEALAALRGKSSDGALGHIVDLRPWAGLAAQAGPFLLSFSVHVSVYCMTNHERLINKYVQN
jgi:hypothetical protein